MPLYDCTDAQNDRILCISRMHEDNPLNGAFQIMIRNIRSTLRRLYKCGINRDTRKFEMSLLQMH